MDEQKQVWGARRAVSVLAHALNKAKDVTELKSAVLTFLTAMDAGEYILGDDDFAALFDAALVRRTITAAIPPSDAKLPLALQNVTVSTP
jgi:hypothetical protein